VAVSGGSGPAYAGVAVQPVTSFQPAYLGLAGGVLRERAERAVAELADCRLCPRDCGVNRLANAWSACKTGRYAVVSSAFPHFGEEDCLRGWNGSGTIFFGHCNLRCVFCQNYDISQAIKPPAKAPGAPNTPEAPGVPGSRPEDLAAMMLALQQGGCHNINFVTPEHVVAQILEAVAIAVERGLRLPLVYNTSAYDALHSIELMNGVVDIYMPDVKYWTSESSAKYLRAADYPEAARRVIKAMHQQVGPLVVGGDGLACRGVLIRHLVMPGALDETRAILEWIARELGPESYVNLMDQYRPEGKVNNSMYPEINRRLTRAEFRAAQQMATDLGLRRLDERNPHPRLLARMVLA
jgi:putative pyruvate formate lyase activating enzyme